MPLDEKLSNGRIYSFVMILALELNYILPLFNNVPVLHDCYPTIGV